MKLLVPALIGAALTVAGAAYAGEKRSKDDKFIIEKVGEPKSCIIRSQIRSTDVIDDRTIDFKMRNGDIYRNTLPNKCSGLRFEEAFSYRTSTNRLCNVDIIRVLDSTAGRIETRSACGLGKFQEITKTKREKVEKNES
ncbi:hypothetical protein [Sphingorhabdus sp. EL138]|uniref:hypothetical protein n=1 Tax=Sphingorhabdus sp. EL138 TaxID=2073156 RepID=UPI000D690127|nr:hypothetical protein [Sphingorhabdus sp. EL138]